ncbi:MAG TPA: phosphatidate cytidylyltransferase [Caulobacteraceae bacterium]|jgi:phosphatidate cytidylyltransferase|nr:phosphatidate cytidylyltransferase [Caulobacteraceae bacterium]
MASSRPAKAFDWKNLRLRVLSTAVLAPAVVLVFWLGDLPFLVLVAAAVAMLAVEWGKMSSPDTPLRTALAMAAAVLVCVVAAYVGHPRIAWLLLPAGAAVAALVVRARGLAERPADAAFGVLYIGGPSIALVWLRSGESDVGRDWALMLLAITWSADIFAFVAGTVLKGPKLWPRFSPNKTWSGLIGGLVASALAAMIVVAVAKGEGDPTRGWAATIGLVVGMFTMAGDLWESMLKRRFGVKDSGDLIPGHGGLLDRVDGLMFAIMAMAGARLVAHVTGYL